MTCTLQLLDVIILMILLKLYNIQCIYIFLLYECDKYMTAA